MSKRLLLATLFAIGLMSWWFLDRSPVPEVLAQGGEKSLGVQAREILNKHCFKCHGAGGRTKAEEVYVLDLKSLTNPKRKDNVLVIPKNGKDSLLLQRILDANNPMPENGLIPEVERKIISDWIAAGAPDWNGEKAKLEGKEIVKETPPKKDPLLNVAKGQPDAKDTAAPVQMIFQSKCEQCHQGSKPEAGLAIFDYAKLIDTEKKIVVPGNPDDSELMKRVSSELGSRMPPDGNTPLTDVEKSQVKEWIRSGANKFESLIEYKPGEVGEAAILKTINDDIQIQVADGRAHRYRYFSLNHLVGCGITERELQAHRDAFKLILNSLSWRQGLVQPKPLDTLKTVFQVDIVELGWDEKPFATLDKTNLKPIAAKTPAQMNLFDLLLLDYPYGVYDSSSRIMQQIANSFFQNNGAMVMVRPIPYLRADWFVTYAGTPPLYEDMLKLPRTKAELEKLLEVNFDDNIKENRVVRGGVSVSGVSKNNRVIERHPGNRGGYYWVSYDFASNRGSQNMFRNPINLKDFAAGGEMVFSLPNRLQGFFVCDSRGNFLLEPPVAIVTDKHASDQIVRNGLSCMRCHEAGIRSITDDVNPIMEKLSGNGGLDKNKVLELFPGQKKLKEKFDIDKASFAAAMKELYPEGTPRIKDILNSVTKRYLDAPIWKKVAPAEIGSQDDGNAMFRGKDLAKLGLFQLSRDGGCVRRDTWEEVYDEVIRSSNLGIPIVPLDGLIRTEYQPMGSEQERLQVTLKGVKEVNGNNVAFAGDKVIVVVKNTTNRKMFYEVVLREIKGDMGPLTPEVKVLNPGEEVRFPEKDSFTVNPGKGVDQLIVYASSQSFEGGELLQIREEDSKRGYGIQDRFVHRQFYQLKQVNRNWGIAMDGAGITKQTINLETK